MRPVIVLTMGRSGSSMVAGCLALHGMWTGHCRPADEHNPKGYFENIRISDRLGELYSGGIYRTLQPMKMVPRWRRFVETVHKAEGYVAGPWLVKVNAFTWPVWLEFDPVFVFVRRGVMGTAESAHRHDAGAFDIAQWRNVVRLHHAEMDKVRERYGGVDIEAPRLIAGEYGQLTPVLSAVGLSLNPSKVAAFVDPALWHHG